MNLYEPKEFVRQCVAVRHSNGSGFSGSVWQCARQQCAAVFLVLVYGSAHGSVRLSGSAAV
jgi:hypothetical protein